MGLEALGRYSTQVRNFAAYTTHAFPSATRRADASPGVVAALLDGQDGNCGLGIVVNLEMTPQNFTVYTSSSITCRRYGMPSSDWYSASSPLMDRIAGSDTNLYMCCD